MINTYRSREMTEAVQWNGENKEELREFVKDDKNIKIDFIFSSNKAAVPIITYPNGIENKIYLGDYVMLENGMVKNLSRTLFEKKFEKIN